MRIRTDAVALSVVLGYLRERANHWHMEAIFDGDADPLNKRGHAQVLEQAARDLEDAQWARKVVSRGR